MNLIIHSALAFQNSQNQIHPFSFSNRQPHTQFLGAILLLNFTTRETNNLTAECKTKFMQSIE